MSQPPRRPVRPTRAPTSRPRRVAGQPRDTPVTDQVETSREDAPVVDLAKPGSAEQAEPAAVPVVDRAEPRADVPGEDEERRATSRRPVVALVVAIALLLGLGAAELFYLASEDEGATDPISAERPVQLPDLEVRRVVDQAATAADAILSATSQDYDAQVEEAVATMTAPFAEEYRATKADVEEAFVAARTEVTVDISAQGVVTATDDEVVALLFLTQTTQKGTRGGVTPVQYRVTVTMVDTADGWLVSDLVAL